MQIRRDRSSTPQLPFALPLAALAVPLVAALLACVRSEVGFANDSSDEDGPPCLAPLQRRTDASPGWMP